MGYMDRNYDDRARQGGGFWARFAECPVVKWLLIVNVVVFVLDFFAAPEGGKSWLYEAGVFTVAEGLMGGQVWRLLTFQFLHVNFFHLALNLYSLFLFGPIVEKWWGSRAFVWYYLLSGLAGALLFAVLVQTGFALPGRGVGTHLLGASAGVFAVLVGAALIAPAVKVMLLIPPIPMTLRTLALVVLGFEVFQVLTLQPNAGGSVGHLGGALMGFGFFKWRALEAFLKKLNAGKVKVVKPAKRKRAGTRGYEPKLKPRVEIKVGAREVDRILDKINEEGLHSLTEEERRILKEAARK